MELSGWNWPTSQRTLITLMPLVPLVSSKKCLPREGAPADRSSRSCPDDRIYARCVRSFHRIFCIFVGSESIFPLIWNINSRLADNWLLNPQSKLYFSSLMRSIEQSKLARLLQRPEHGDLWTSLNISELWTWQPGWRNLSTHRQSSPGARKSTVTVLEQGCADSPTDIVARDCQACFCSLRLG